MKKQYEEPKAEKMEFDYDENVVASLNAKGGKTGNAINSCFTHNTDNMWTNPDTCTGIPKE